MSETFPIDPVTETSEDNAAATATVSAVSGSRIEGVMLHWSYSATPTSGKVTLKKGSTTISEVDITASGPGFLPLDGFITGYGEALAATIAAAGSGVVGKVSISAKRA